MPVILLDGQIGNAGDRACDLCHAVRVCVFLDQDKLVVVRVERLLTVAVQLAHVLAVIVKLRQCRPR